MEARKSEISPNDEKKSQSKVELISSERLSDGSFHKDNNEGIFIICIII